MKYHRISTSRSHRNLTCRPCQLSAFMYLVMLHQNCYLYPFQPSNLSQSPRYYFLSTGKYSPSCLLRYLQWSKRIHPSPCSQRFLTFHCHLPLRGKPSHCHHHSAIIWGLAYSFSLVFYFSIHCFGQIINTFCLYNILQRCWAWHHHPNRSCFDMNQIN